MRVRSHIALYTYPQTDITDLDLEKEADETDLGLLSSSNTSETTDLAEHPKFSEFFSSLMDASDFSDTPITFQEALELLAKAKGASSIVRATLRYARSLFSRTFFFVIKKNHAVCLDAIGQGIQKEDVQQIKIPLDQNSVFSLVCQNRSHYLGGLPKNKIHVKFLRTAGKKIPLSVFVLPIFLRGRMINILYGDNGHKVHCSNQVGELLVLAQHLSRSYQALLEQKELPARKQHKK